MDTLTLGAAVFGFVTVVLAAAGVRSLLVRGHDEVLSRVERAVAPEATASAVAPVKAHSPWLAKALGPLARLSGPKDQSADYTRMKAQLAYAGYRHPWTIEIFFGAKLALALLAAAAVMGASAMSLTGLSHAHAWSVVAAAIAYYAPNLWLGSRVRARQGAVARSLPDSLDLLITCLESGLGLEAALARITREIGLSAPELATELQQTTLEIQAGIVRADAFRRLADRTGLEDLRSLSAVLIQTEMFGTSVAHALRVHASSMRINRTHRAEERAAKVAVKMLLPLVLFILPSLFAVILGPAVVRIATVLMPALTGGHR